MNSMLELSLQELFHSSFGKLRFFPRCPVQGELIVWRRRSELLGCWHVTQTDSCKIPVSFTSIRSVNRHQFSFFNIGRWYCLQLFRLCFLWACYPPSTIVVFWEQMKLSSEALVVLFKSWSIWLLQLIIATPFYWSSLTYCIDSTHSTSSFQQQVLYLLSLATCCVERRNHGYVLQNASCTDQHVISLVLTFCIRRKWSPFPSYSSRTKCCQQTVCLPLLLLLLYHPIFAHKPEAEHH